MSTAISTGLLAAGTYLITATKGMMNGVLAMPGATVTCYDNAAGVASGTVLDQAVNAGTSSIDHMYNVPVRFDNGLTVVVSGGSGIVLWGGV